VNALLLIAVPLLHAELSTGAPGDVAVKAVLNQLEGRIKHPLVKTIVTEVLNGIVAAEEKLVDALPGV